MWTDEIQWVFSRNTLYGATNKSSISMLVEIKHASIKLVEELHQNQAQVHTEKQVDPIWTGME